MWGETDWWKGIQSKNGANALIGLGTGLLSGKTFAEGLGLGGQEYMKGAQLDQQYADEASEEEKRIAQINQTAAFLREKGAEDLAAAVEGGMTTGADAFNQWYAKANAGPAKPIEVGGVLLDPNTYEPIFDSREADKPTSSMQEYDFARSQGYQGTFQEYETDMKRAGATSIDFNANQGTAAGFADRMANANRILEDPALTQAQTDMGQQGLGKVPVVGNFLTSEQKKLADQAQRDFINAILRRESGAVIADSEFANAAQQYFPQPGDSPAVIEQKRQNRLIAIQGVTRSAGPSYQPPTLTPPGVVPYTDFFK